MKLSPTFLYSLGAVITIAIGLWVSRNNDHNPKNP